jgi:hypothetical protein
MPQGWQVRMEPLRGHYVIVDKLYRWNPYSLYPKILSTYGIQPGPVQDMYEPREAW